jgi:HK97 family phage prohead protease
MEFPADLFVKPVAGDDDLFAFRIDFVPEGKAVEDGPTQVVTEAENGDLIIEGYAAVFEGMDRQNENFAEGAFQRGIKSFLKGQAGLCFHHKHDKLLGKVLELEEEEGKGLRMKARVDGAIRKHPELGVYYEQIKNGSLNALSVGGFFKRALSAAGRKIVDMDFTEISVTPVPVHPGTNFAVVAGKALVGDIEKVDNVKLSNLPGPKDEIRDEDLAYINDCVATLERIIERIGTRKSDSTQASA